MKLSYKNAWLITNIVLFPLWLIKVICTLPYYIFLAPILLYDITWRWADINVRLKLQGRSGKEWYE